MFKHFIAFAVFTLLAISVNADIQVDPMRPQWGTGSSASSTSTTANRTTPARSFTLQSILIIDQQKSAVINQQRVNLGDSIQGARVVAIEPKQVVINVQGKDRVLSLYTRKALIEIIGDKE